MAQYIIKKAQTGNCSCFNCTKFTGKYQPWTLWVKEDGENRGHNLPMCSEECCKEYAEDYYS